MSNSKIIAKNAAVLMAGDVIGRILSFAFIILLARYLGDIGLGKYSFIFAFIGILEIFSDFGMSTFLIREIARKREKAEEYFENLLTFKIILALFVFVTAAIAVNLIDKNQDVRIAVAIVGIATVFYYLKEFFGIILQAFERMEYYSLANLIERIITVGLGITVLILGGGIIALSLVFLFSYFVTCCTAFMLARKIALKKIRLRFDPAIIKGILKQSLPFWFTGIFILIYFRIDTVMLSMMKDYQVVGWYNAAYRMLDALYFIPGAVIAAVFPAMSRLYHENKELLVILYQRSFYYLFMIGLPIGIGTTILADRIVYFMYGDQFTAAVPALQILIWAVVFTFLSGISGFLLNATNKQTYFALITAFGAVFNVVTNLIFIPKYSYIGASITTIATEFIVLTALFFFAWRDGFKVNAIKTVLKPAIAGLVMAFAIINLTSLHILLIVPISAAIYFAVLLLIRGISTDEFNILRQLASYRKKD